MKNYRYELPYMRYEFIGCNADTKKEALKDLRDKLRSEYGIKATLKELAEKIIRY